MCLFYRVPCFLVASSLLAAGLAAIPAVAQPSAPYLVEDINRQASPAEGGVPEFFQSLAEGVVFVRSVPGGETQLWRTDGTAAGTFRLAADCDIDCLVSPQLLAASDELAYYLGTNAFFGRDLWGTDGSPAGTRRLTNLPPGAVLFDGRFGLDSASGRLYFLVNDGETGFEPWVSDGTAAGTRLLADIHPGPESSLVSFGLPGGGLGSTVFFAADDGTTGIELWATDGTPAGTRRVRDIWNGPESSSPSGFARVGDAVLFFAEDPQQGRELWRTDGTEAGTRPVVDLTPGPEGTPGPGRLLVVDDPGGDKALFVVQSDLLGTDLWVTDGTAAGTFPLGSFASEHPSIVPRLITTTSRLLFWVEDGTPGWALWSSDGTPEGTFEIPAPCPGLCPEPSVLRDFGGTVVFNVDDGVHGRELWVTDATPEGTHLAADLCPGECSSEPFPVTGAGGQVLFIADDGLSGFELWRTRGEPASTVRLTTFESREPFGNRREAGRLGSAFVFYGIDLDHGLALWLSDGTPQGTAPFATLTAARNDGSFPEELTVLGDRVLFTALDGVRGEALWASDGTAEGTERVRVVSTDPVAVSVSRLTALTAAGDRLFFITPNPDEGPDLWVSDGTEEGTVRVREAVDRPFSQAPHLVALGERLLFFTFGGQARLWVSDGTAEGTGPIQDLEGVGFLSPVAFEGAVYFFAGTPQTVGQMALWRSDGTPAGTAPVLDLGDSTSIDPRELTRVGGQLFFTARDDGNRVLWVSDGTAAGTAPVERSGATPAQVSDLIAVGGRVFFFGLDAEDRESLWASDGTGAGTVRLAAVPLSRRFFLPPQTAVLDGRLFFIAEDPVQPPRLWVSDGTPAGTRPFDLLPSFLEPAAVWAAGGQVIAAGVNDDVLAVSLQLWAGDAAGAGAVLLGNFAGRAAPEEIGEFLALGDRVLFRATDETFGTELWAFGTGGGEPPPPPPGPPAAPTDLEAEPISPTSVRLTWTDNAGNETGYTVERNSPQFPPLAIAFLPADSESFVVENLEAGVPSTFRVRAVNGSGPSEWSREASATPFDEVGGPCNPTSAALCLLGDRFRVRVHWKDHRNGGNGLGVAGPFDFSDDSGTFWFFDPANVELVVKVLDARPVNGFYWFFYGALSNVEYWITVTDTAEGTNRTYHNPPGELCGQGDVRAFPRPPASASASTSFGDLARTTPDTAASQIPDELPPSCAPGPENLCLNGNRFRVEVAWTDPRSGDSGVGQAIPGTDDSGFFWFFDAENVELVVKVLDGRLVNQRFWVFYGALSDVEYEITVTDTRNDVVKVYRNEPGNICGQADTLAF
jgi:ELWxxDGT repeat protein